MRHVRRGLFGLALFLTAATPALANKRLVYGPRIGDEVDIVSATGIGTRRAVIKVKLTGDSAPADLKDHIEGDCVSGWFTILYPGNDRFRFMGRLRHLAAAGAHYLILYKGKPLDGSTASSYGEALEQYNALCPGHVDLKLDQ